MSAEGPVDLLIVDDHAGVRDELVALFAELGYAPRAAGSAAAAIAAVRAQVPRAMVLDIHLGDGSASDVLRALAPPPCPVLLLSGVAELDEVVEGLSLGAADFAEKDAPHELLAAAVGELVARATPAEREGDRSLALACTEPASLDEALEALVGGRLGVVADFVQRGARHVVLAERARPRPLSPLERAVILASADGRPMKEAAAELGLSEAHAWSALGSATRKLGLANRARLARLLSAFGGPRRAP